MAHRDLRVLDAAEKAAVLVIKLIDRSRRRLVEVKQLRKSAVSVPLNIGEGFGRKTLEDRNYKLFVARGEAEEVIKALRLNHGSGRIAFRKYRALHDRYVVIVKMLNGLMAS